MTPVRLVVSTRVHRFVPGNGTHTDVWYDAVAAFMAVTLAPTYSGPSAPTAYLEFETVPVVVTPDGHTVVKAGGAMVTEALAWRNLPAFLLWVGDSIAKPAP